MFRDSTKILYFRYKYKVIVYNVLRWRSESAEGDGAAHQPYIQVNYATLVYIIRDYYVVFSLKLRLKF